MYVTGAIELASNIVLDVDAGATLRFHTDLAEYPLVPGRSEGTEGLTPAPLIGGRNLQNVSIIGRNGVGKTTLLATVMGHTRLHNGEVKLAGRSLNRVPIYARALAGLGYVPQEREIFPSLTVEENLTVAEQPGQWSLCKIYDFFPALAEHRRNHGNQLSGGEQQMLAIGRALIRDPRMLLLDEPFEGLAPIIVRDLVETTRTLAGDGYTILIVEQNIRAAMRLAHRCYVMSKGRIVFEGTPHDLESQPEIMHRYLGV